MPRRKIRRIARRDAWPAWVRTFLLTGERPRPGTDEAMAFTELEYFEPEKWRAAWEDLGPELMTAADPDKPWGWHAFADPRRPRRRDEWMTLLYGRAA